MAESNPIDKHLKKAIEDGDLRTVQILCEVDGVNWRQGDQQALYFALQEDARDIAAYFIKDLFKDRDEETQKAFAATINIALVPQGGILSQFVLALQGGATGLFRHMAETKPDEVRRMAPALIVALEALDFIKPALAIGCDKEFMNGAVLSLAVAKGDTALVEFMLENGADPNVRENAKQPTPDDTTKKPRHCLHEALKLEDEGLRLHMLQLLHNAGADLRSNKADGLKDMLCEDPRLVIDYYGPASKLPLLIALAEGATLPEGTRAVIEHHYPEALKWRQSQMLPYLFDAQREDSSRWYEKLKARDRAEDDALLLKLVILSDDARTITPFMMSLGFSPRAERDRPLTLAVMLGKAEVFNTLASNGADIYAGNGEAFALARQLDDAESLAALQQLTASLEERFAKKLKNQFSTGMTLPTLRVGRTEDNGDTGLVTLAKAGMAQELAEKGVLYGMTAADFLSPSKQQSTFAAILAARGEHKLLFDERIWGRDDKGPQAVFASLSDYDKAVALPYFRETQQSQVARANQEDLRDRAKNLKLKP